MKSVILGFADILKKTLLFFIILCLFASFCAAKSKKNSAPYFIDGKINLQAEDSEKCAVDLCFHNKSEKKVAKYTVVFFLFDADGEIYSNGKNNFTLTAEQEILPDESAEQSIFLDDFFYEDCDDYISIDYLYVSQIEYEDGSIWQDPFGLAVF